MSVDLSLDLSSFTRLNGVYLISPPQQFEGGEEAYDEHIGGAHREDSLLSGRGAWQLIRRHASRPVDTVLELGSGGGTCSLGLVADGPGVRTIITDTSPAFLEIVRRKIAAAGLPAKATFLCHLGWRGSGSLTSGKPGCNCHRLGASSRRRLATLST